MAVIMAQAINLGNHGMSETSDIPYHSLKAAHQQYLRLSTLKSANDRISNFIAGLAIFPHYSLDLEVLYGSVDGQKFESADPTIKARLDDMGGMALTGSAADFGKLITDETDKWGKVIRDAGIKAE